MAQLFSDEWINKLKDAWNETPDVKEKLAEANFSSVITCGYVDEEKPRCVFIVENGEAIEAGLYSDEEPDWDMRATKDNWIKWSEKPLNMTGMGIAVATGKLKFYKGDYASMIKNPTLAGPFIKSFALMNKIGVEA